MACTSTDARRPPQNPPIRLGLVAIMFVSLSIAWRNQSWEFHGVYLAALVTLAFVGFYVLAKLAATWDQPKMTRKDFQEKLRARGREATMSVGPATLSRAGGNSPQGMIVTPDGRFVVVANESTSNVSVFSLNSSTGALIAVTGSPFGSGDQPGPVTIHPSGKFIFVGNTGGNSLSAYSIDSTGGLTALSGTPIPLGTNAQPSSIAVDHAGKFVFVSIVPQEAVGFALDSNTGALTPVKGSPFSIGAVTRDMVFAP